MSYQAGDLGCLTNAALMQVDVVRLSRETSIARAVQALTRAKARYAVVEDELGAFVGLVSDRDIRLALPSRLEPGPSEDARAQREANIMAVCIQRPYTVDLKGPVVESARLMLAMKVGCLPVIDAGGRAAGLLTLADFARVFVAISSRPGQRQARRPIYARPEGPA